MKSLVLLISVISAELGTFVSNLLPSNNTHIVMKQADRIILTYGENKDMIRLKEILGNYTSKWEKEAMTESWIISYANQNIVLIYDDWLKCCNNSNWKD